MRKLGIRGGIVVDNLLGLILVGIALIIFVVAVYKFYETSLNQDSKVAQDFIDSLSAKIGALDHNERVNASFRGIANWYLVSWSADDNDRPDKCTFFSCICACHKPDPISCQEDGFCREVESKNVEVFTYPYLITKTTSGARGAVFSSNKNYSKYCIMLPSNLIEIEIAKFESNLTLSYHELRSSSEVTELTECKERNV